MPRTDEQNRARRAWASALARHEAAEPLARVLNSVYVRGYEKREVQALLLTEPWLAPAELARIRALIEARANDPHSLENWHGRQRFARANSPTASDYTEQPSRFNTRKEHTTI